MPTGGSLSNLVWLGPALWAPVVATLHPATTSDLDILGIVLGLVLFVLCSAVHEAAHAWVAWRCGDPTAKDLGRLTLNPIPHIDPWMTILLPLMLLWASHGRFAFGGAKPVPVNFHRLRHPWRDMSLVALAGPASNILLAVLFLLLRQFFVSTGFYNGAAPIPEAREIDLLPVVLDTAAGFNVILAVFNLVPIPPLDGSRVMAWILPGSVREAYLRFESFGLLVIFGLYYLVTPFRIMLWETEVRVLDTLRLLVGLGGAA